MSGRPKILQCCKDTPLHPELKSKDFKSYSWDGKNPQIIQDWKGSSLVFVKFRDFANNSTKLTQFIKQFHKLCSEFNSQTCPEILFVADSLTPSELMALAAQSHFDVFDMQPAATVSERLTLLLQQVKFRKSKQRELKTLSAELNSIKNENKDLKRLTLTDDLTGLHNTRYMKEIFEGIFELVHRYDRPLSVVMLDLDHFKDVNDRNDHLVGSTVLKEMGRVLKRHTRKSDIRIRYGGDEFVIVMPETGANVATKVAERIREKLERLSMTVHSDYVVKITASLGVATFSRRRHSAYWELLREADIAMYEAKRCGRNKVCTFGGEIKGYETSKSSFATVLKQIMDEESKSRKKELPEELTKYLNLIKKAA